METECEWLTTNFRAEQDQHLRTQQLYNDLILQEKQFRQKIVKLEKEAKEKQLSNRDEIDAVRAQLKTLEKRFEQLQKENETLAEAKTRRENEFREHDDQVREEIQRLKRDLGLELYRKQDAEKKSRACEEKLRQVQKVQVDLTKTKHELKTLQVKYDALQFEMIEMHRTARSKRRTNDEGDKLVKKVKRASEENASLGRTRGKKSDDRTGADSRRRTSAVADLRNDRSRCVVRHGRRRFDDGRRKSLDRRRHAQSVDFQTNSIVVSAESK